MSGELPPPGLRPGSRWRGRRAEALRPTSLHEQVAAALVERAGRDDVAFVLDPQEGVSWSCGPDAPWSPETATSRLVQGLYRQHGTRAALEIRPATGVADLIRVGPGEPVLFRLAADATPYLIANTAAVEFDYVVVDP